MQQTVPTDEKENHPEFPNIQNCPQLFLHQCLHTLSYQQDPGGAFAHHQTELFHCPKSKEE